MFTISFEEDDPKFYMLLKALAISATDNGFHIEEEGKIAELFFEIYSHAPEKAKKRFKKNYISNLAEIANLIVEEAAFFEKASYCANLIDKFPEIFNEYKGREDR